MLRKTETVRDVPYGENTPAEGNRQRTQMIVIFALAEGRRPMRPHGPQMRCRDRKITNKRTIYTRRSTV